jgi:predicted nucleic acid-binding Zn ribbon protein
MTYEYKCENCADIHVVVCSYKERDKLNVWCKKCHQPMQYVYQATPVHFKGEGWTK